MNICFTKYNKVYLAVSAVLISASIFALAFYGLNFGIDFNGGSVLQIEYKTERLSKQEITDIVSNFDIGAVSVRVIGEKGAAISFEKSISQDTQTEIKQALSKEKEIIEGETSFEKVGGIVGEETKSKSGKAIIFSLIAIILYVAFAFRKLLRPVSSWQYGFATLIALFHDMLLVLGVFAVLGEFSGVYITIPIMTALLTVFGYSVNDTVVVFDRIRENLIKRTGTDFEDVVNKSMNQTLFRSASTSLTTLFVLFAIFFLGGETLKYFSLALIIGIISGTYSSIFLASPLLVYWAARKGKV